MPTKQPDPVSDHVTIELARVALRLRHLLDLMARVIACGTEKNPEKLDAGTRSDRIPMLLQVCAERLGELNVNSQVIRETADHFASLLVLRDLVANLQSREGSIIGVLSGEPGAASSPPEAKR